MTPTSDERREVAYRLRKEANGYRRNRAHGVRTEIDLGDVPGVFQDMTHFCWLHGTVRCEDMLDRLADLIDPTLIDPTCHMVDTDHEYEDSIRCDVCQMTFNRPWEPFKFCPNCGARVVERGED